MLTPIALLLLVGGLLACGPQPQRPDVLLITIDTLRGDHLSSTGYGRGTSRSLDWLVQEGVVFQNASSTASWTAPAMASLFTSLDPIAHGVRRGIVPKFLTSGDKHVRGQQVLDDSFVTLAECMRGAGYRTLGFSTNPHLVGKLGFAQGFDHFESLAPPRVHPSQGDVYADAAQVADRVREVVEAQRGAGPLFVWIHFVDPHVPYHARQPWAARYGQEAGIPAGGLPEVAVAEGVLLSEGTDRDQERRLLLALYDSEIHYVSDQIAALLAALSPSPEALIVLTADHGQSFFGHGEFGHSLSLYEAEIHVPLVIRFPAHMALRGTVRTPVSLLDVMPTVLDVAGIEAPPALEGHSLVGLARDDDGGAEVPVFADLGRFRRELRSVREGRWKLIRNLRTGKDELYDLDSDPHEQHDLAAVEPERVRALRRSLDAFLQRAQEVAHRPQSRALDDEGLRRLRALGYVR